jgi:hypothetical protein
MGVDVKVVPEADLFILNSTVAGTTTVDLLLNGQSSATVVCGPNFRLILHRANLTNPGTVAITLSFLGVSTVTGAPSPIPLGSYVLAAGTTLTISEEQKELFVTTGYRIQGTVSAGTAIVDGVARFAPGG